ncbi:hypothetical protein ASPCAL09387 [Aspergillus calidoustus]|uniref:Uncharacterized protein n=1 Tax=Aspergillus calidoustus TaxID=454130 RepID=A0A0U5GVC5_ASPCI|nr:hypothetical protein ASPCAL09387 [Aspergillus calidoustus]
MLTPPYPVSTSHGLGTLLLTIIALLPLLVNQLDGYVRGLEKIKSSRRYRLEIRGYRIGLSAQHANLLNTLELLLEDIVDDYDKRQALITDPKGPGWTSPDLQQKLVQKLGRNNAVFLETATGLCELLNSLAKKLGLKDADRLKTDSLPFSQALKFRMMFSRAVYDDLLAKIDATNQILRSLADHSRHRPQIRGSHRQKKVLRAYQTARKHARALYNSIVRGHCWKCLNTCQHSVRLQLQLVSIQSAQPAVDGAMITGHTLILSSSQVGSKKRWWKGSFSSTGR